MNITLQNRDKDSKEADLLIPDGEHTLLAYCPNYNGRKSNDGASLCAFLPENIEKTSLPVSIEKSDAGFYAYRIVGVLVERRKDRGKVQIGEIEIELRTIPNDIKIGENISFDVLRIDFYVKSY